VGRPPGKSASLILSPFYLATSHFDAINQGILRQ
jgi:hypothetical protein